jgi:hypothetical protein
MELPGETYLFNLSLIAVTFAVVSALVMMMRQTMGGKLSNFDIYLTSTYISFGFALAVAAILPPLVSFFELLPPGLWAVSSVLAAVLVAGTLTTAIHRRRLASSDPLSPGVMASFAIHVLGVILLLVNAAVVPWQGIHLFAVAVTLSIGSVMWAFVRRIASVLGEKPSEDWDPKRG